MSENTTTTYSARLPETTKQRLQDAMSNTDCTVSDFFDRLLNAYQAQNQLTTKRPEVREIEKATKTILANMDTLLARIDNADVDKHNLSNKYITDLDALQAEIDALQALQATTKSEHIKTLTDLQTTLATANITITDLQTTITDQKNEIKKLRENELFVSEIVAEKRDLKNALADTTIKLQNMEEKYQSKLSEMEEKYQSEHEKNIKIEAQIEILQKYAVVPAASVLETKSETTLPESTPKLETETSRDETPEPTSKLTQYDETKTESEQTFLPESTPEPTITEPTKTVKNKPGPKPKTKPKIVVKN